MTKSFFFQAAYEVKHMHAVQADRLRNLQKLNSKLNERFTKETQLVQIVDDQIHLSITSALSSDDSRKAAFQLAFDEDQQIVAVSEILPNFQCLFEFWKTYTTSVRK